MGLVVALVCEELGFVVVPASSGSFPPGSTMYEDDSASERCVSNEVEAFYRVLSADDDATGVYHMELAYRIYHPNHTFFQTRPFSGTVEKILALYCLSKDPMLVAGRESQIST